MTRKRNRQLTPLFAKGDEDLMILFSVDDKRTLTRWRKEGLPFCKDHGVYRYDIDEVREWIHDYCEKNPNTETFYTNIEDTNNGVIAIETKPQEPIQHVNLSTTRFKRTKIS